MNVVYGDHNRELLGEKFTTLELESFAFNGFDKPVTTYAVVGPADLVLENLLKLKQMIPVHEALIKNYKQQNWHFCITAIQQLKGNIDPFMDSFYDILLERILEQQTSPTKDWTPVISPK